MNKIYFKINGFINVAKLSQEAQARSWREFPKERDCGIYMHTFSYFIN